MTGSEKDAIRNRPCALCLALPPFPDGSRCHVHRIVRGKEGGQYIEGNVVPLCPPCHVAVDQVAMIANAYEGGRKGGLKGGRRAHELYPNRGRELGLKYGRVAGRKGGLKSGPIRMAILNSDPANRRKAIAAREERKRRDGLTPGELAHVREAGRAAIRAMNAALSPAERSAKARRAALALHASRTPEQRSALASKAGRASRGERV
jgi:hypothetical protein